MTAAALGSLVGLGCWLLLIGFQRRETKPVFSTELWKTISNLWKRVPRWVKYWAPTAMLLGLITASATRWLPAALLLPILAIAVPLLLSSPRNHEVDLLAALDRWVKLISTSLGTGRSIRDAIFATRSQAPALLAEPVARLCLRLDQSWPTRDALEHLASELDSGDADAVLAAMMSSASRGGMGARSTLEALSESIQARLHALRDIAAERAKPRAVVQQVTIITLVVLGSTLLFSPQFFKPYTTPLGSVLALTLTVIFLGSLWMLRHKTLPDPTPRFLQDQR